MRLQETRQIERPPEEIFSFTADFANAEKWDPGVSSSRPVGNGPVGVGSRYDVMVSFGSREVPMTHQVTEWEPTARVVLVGSGETIEAVDEIRFEARGSGTVVYYVADLSFTNWIRFLGPVDGATARPGREEGTGRARGDIGALSQISIVSITTNSRE